MCGVMDILSLPYGDGFTMVGGTTFDSLVQFTSQQLIRKTIYITSRLATTVIGWADL